jgi:hypothetical protein
MTQMPKAERAMCARQIKFSKETMEAEKSTASNNFALAFFIKVEPREQYTTVIAISPDTAL